MNVYQNPMEGEQWIGLPEGSIETKWTGVPQTAGAFFRRVFSAPSGAKKVLHITASSRYALFVNGRFVQNGPCKGDTDHQYVDTLDITGFIVPGDNVLTVHVINFSTEESADMGYRDYGPCAVLPKPTGPLLLVKDEDGEVSTRLPGWQALCDTATSWIFDQPSWYIGSKQRIDGSRIPDGLHSVKSSAAWAQPRLGWAEAANPWGEMLPFHLEKRPIPLMRVEERAFVRQQPQRPGEAGVDLAIGRVRAGEQAVMELDAGEVVTGYPRLTVRGGKGSVITLRYAECYITPEGKGRRDDWENGRIEGHYDEFLPSGNGDAFQTFWFRTFRYVRVEIKAGAEDVTIGSIDYLDTRYPLVRKSSVSSQANPWVEQLFHISANTLERCMQETYVDCPYYEQLQYTQDARLEMLFTYSLSADDTMARRTISDFHNSLLPEGMLQSRFPSRKRQVIPGFALYWIMMLEDHFTFTDDIEIPRRFRPTVDAVLDWFLRRVDADGWYKSTEHWPYFDWVKEWEHGVPDAVRHGASTIMNLHLALGLKSGAKIMRATGRPEVAEEYLLRAGKILDLVERSCWDAQKGLYLEGPDYHKEFTQHTQIWAVLTGLAKGERARAILNKALDDKSLRPCSFTMMYFLFRALEQAGLYERTRDLWEMYKSLLPLGCTTVPEIPVQPRSECHGWGALALWDFPRYFLGVRETAPGWQSAVIDPKALWLNDCSGVAATPKGDVRISWRIEGDRFLITGQLPEGMDATLRLPDGTERKVAGAFSAQCDMAGGVGHAKQ